MTMRSILYLCCLLILPVAVRAQSVAAPTRDNFRSEIKTPSRKLWAEELASLAAAESVDFITTTRGQGTGNEFETNPILGHFPSDARVAAYGASEFAIYAVALHFTESSRHKWIRVAGRAALAYQVEIHVRAGIHNAELRP